MLHGVGGCAPWRGPLSLGRTVVMLVWLGLFMEASRLTQPI